MCGICGVAEGSGQDSVARMSAKLIHRGPDDVGFNRFDGISIGVRRLSIIDVLGGRQPIASEDGSVVVVLNGEIYNYPELRKRLGRQGHTFSTQSDTEVLVHLYEEYGDSFVQLLQGMFAFALWDNKRHRLLLARDRLGIKPLYYAIIPDGLVFASEAKALFQHPKLNPEINSNALGQYLSLLTPRKSECPPTTYRKLRY